MSLVERLADRAREEEAGGWPEDRARWWLNAIADELCVHRVMLKCPYRQCERDADVGEGVADWLREQAEEKK